MLVSLASLCRLALPWLGGAQGGSLYSEIRRVVGRARRRVWPSTAWGPRPGLEASQQGRLVPKRGGTRVPRAAACLPPPSLPPHPLPQCLTGQPSHPLGVGKASAEEASEAVWPQGEIPKCTPSSSAAPCSLGIPRWHQEQQDGASTAALESCCWRGSGWAGAGPWSGDHSC